MKFSNNLIKTIHDIEGETCLLIHGICGCNFNCYGCLNRSLLTMNNDEKYLSENDILEILKDNGYFFDSLILSGGEITLFGEKLYEFIKNIKSIYNGKIIIYTNGTNPNIIEYLSNIVDGFHIDIKYNIFSENKDSFNICGVDNNNFYDSIIKSMDIIYKNNKGYSKFRTVKYPHYSQGYLKNIEIIINEKYPNIEYKQNEFIEI